MNFQGDQLNYLDTMFRIGYAVFLIVSPDFKAAMRCPRSLTHHTAFPIDLDEHETKVLASAPGACLGYLDR